jgi:D-aminopeptidase
MGLARTGSTSGNGSGDLFIAFSTANPIFDATVYAVEEALVNAMEGAETMTGFAGHRVTHFRMTNCGS